MGLIQHHVQVKQFMIANYLPIALIAGPCQLESREHAFFMAKELKELCASYGVNFIYKTSFDKANRTSGKAQRGLGLEKSLAIFDELRAELDIPIITDVHLPEQCAIIAPHVDMLQIPAFLCRQTDLIHAARDTGLPLNIKKGQFISPMEVEPILRKAFKHPDKTAQIGFETNVMICERGTSFGYNTLINDMTAIPQMVDLCHPVIFDASHSVQRPGAGNGCTIGNRNMVPYLARAAVAVGVAGVFIECHQDPDHAPSDGPNMMHLRDMSKLLKQLTLIDTLTKEWK